MMPRSSYPAEFAEERLRDGRLVVEAWHPNLPGCRSHGASREEALESLADARGLYVRTLRERGVTLPGPSATRPG